LTEAALRKAKEFNSQRYYYQGIGRYAPSAAYARGLADLQVLANLIPADGYVHGPKPTSSMLPSTDSSPIFISTRSILHSGSSLRRIPISFDIALQFTPPSVRKFKVDVEKKPYSTNRIDLLARLLESGQGAACVFFHRLRRVRMASPIFGNLQLPKQLILNR
jgi:hypothetical protein